jgi:hypothetical protein
MNDWLDCVAMMGRSELERFELLAALATALAFLLRNSMTFFSHESDGK